MSNNRKSETNGPLWKMANSRKFFMSKLTITLTAFACSNPFGSDERPEPGPIVCSSNMNQKNGNMALFTMNEDGTNLQRLINDSYSYSWARWSPDGKKLVFNSTKERTHIEGLPIFIMDVETRSVTKISEIGAGPIMVP